MEANRYKIKTIGDILALPEDKREACCIDLLALGRLADASIGSGYKVCTNRFTWIDDDHTGKISGFSLLGETRIFEKPVIF
jgi:hypothetical protein